MKLHKLLPFLMASALCLAPASAQFGLVVYDPTTVGKLITHVNNQIQNPASKRMLVRFRPWAPSTFE